jgi:uncharacterized membrane protein YwaF
MEYFWCQQDDIPESVGYPLFGRVHLFSVGITFALVALLVAWLVKSPADRRRKVMKCIPLFMVALEVWKDLFLVSVGRFGIGYLPLHLCSIGIAVFLLHEFVRWEPAKAVFGEVAYVLMAPGALAGLVFADWTELYPALNFINLHSYLWHGLLLAYPLTLRFSGEVVPRFKNIPWVVAFIVAVAAPIYAFDKAMGCNYLFVNWPVTGSPLEWLVAKMGNPGYLLGYGALVLAVILLVYLADYGLRPGTERRGCASRI